MRTVVTATRTRSGRMAASLFGTMTVLALAHCGGGEAGSGSSSGGGQVEAGASSSGGSDGSTCAAKTCADTANCGTYDDGCGGSLTCQGGCSACTPGTFASVCPQHPCETLVGCTDNHCTYAPVTCGNAGDEQTCAPVPCEGEACGNVATAAGQDDKLYACGGHVCNAVTAYCDPRATVSGGVISFQNLCIDPPQGACGTCGLGAQSCDPAIDRFRCDDVAVPALEAGGTVECDSTLVGSTFVYMDALYTQGSSDGSKQHPFTTYPAALESALGRNARGIVIARSPVFTEPLRVTDGIGIYGGFGASPDFAPQPSERPRWQVPATAIANNMLVGVIVKGVSEGTALHHLAIVTADVTSFDDGFNDGIQEGIDDGVGGASNVGVWVEDSNGLRLSDILITPGDAGPGVSGESGANGSFGGDAFLDTPGAAGAGCAIPACTLVPNRFNGNVCGRGGTFDSYTGWPGNPGDNEVENGGAAGQRSDYCSVNSATFGQPGTDGIDGIDGIDGADGLHAELQAGTVSSRKAGDGTAGTPGRRGGGGGAGGSQICSQNQRGGNGGGAGGPGCPGTRAGGGGSGGLSLGVALVGTTSMLVVTGGTITGGVGGAGGNGGAGGAQGPGGNGGLSSNPEGNARLGGKGGKGGHGGRGGSGGAGAGGDSFAVACASASTTVKVGANASLTGGQAGATGGSVAGTANPGRSAPTSSTCTVVPFAP